MLPSKSVVFIAGGLVAAAAGYVAYKKMAGAAASVSTAFADMTDFVIGEALPAINPVNPNNVFNTGANQAVQAVTGSDETIGGHVYEMLHTGEHEELSIFSPDGIRHMVFGDKDKTLFNFWK